MNTPQHILADNQTSCFDGKPVFRNADAETLVVSVAMITYNQEQYIAQAIDSVLMQAADFRIELVIGEDNSTDLTRKICETYASQYPGRVKLLPSETNLGMMKNAQRTKQACTGKYIAFLEGDDYWTDPLKLQKQVDFLESNPAYSFCFHNVQLIHEGFPEKDRLANHTQTPSLITLDDFLKTGNMVVTASVVIRNELLRSLPGWFNKLPFGDFPIYLILAKQGKVRYLPDVMAVYRIHHAGAHGHLTHTAEGMVNIHRKQYKFWKIIRRHDIIDKQQVNVQILCAINETIQKAILTGNKQVLVRYNANLLVHSRGKQWRKVLDNFRKAYQEGGALTQAGKE